MVGSENLLTLERLQKNESAEVVGFEKCGRQVLDRLLAMGITKGTVIRIIRYAPMGDPMDIEVMGTNLSLRGDEAKLVQVRRK